jgi:hypothetical protein
MTQLNGFVEKGWGHELIWATNDKYCGKLLKFNKDAKFSMHFHAEKDESWYVLDGRFLSSLSKHMMPVYTKLNLRPEKYGAIVLFNRTKLYAWKRVLSLKLAHLILLKIIIV